jgi:hypothetical protein
VGSVYGKVSVLKIASRLLAFLAGRESIIMKFDFVTRMWMNEDGTFIVNSCALCGREERGHGMYTLCFTAENKHGRYVAPSNTLRLQRMKANRAAKTA